MKRGTGTTAVHGRREARPGPPTTPLVQSSTFAFADSGGMRRYLEGAERLYPYTRYPYPTLPDPDECLRHRLSRWAGLVMTSVTTALWGPAVLFGGARVGSREGIGRARSSPKVLGGLMGPHPSFLVLRGLKTLPRRVARQCDNALVLA